MGIRSQIDLIFKLGANNDLSEGSLVGDVEFQQLVDTLAKAQARSGALDPDELATIDKGDIDTIRMLYIEADGDIDVFLGGTDATTAVVTGVGGVYPTLFAGGEDLDLEIDGTTFTVTFEVGDQSLADVIKRVNAAGAYNDIDGLIADPNAGQLRLTSQDEGLSSIVRVTGGSARTALGLGANPSDQGVDPTPGASPILLRRPADTAGTQIDTLKVMFLATVQTTNLQVANVSETDAVSYRILFAGDLAPAASCS